jgi:hypothetical protein
MKKLIFISIVLFCLCYLVFNIYYSNQNNAESRDVKKFNKATHAAEYFKYRMASRADENGYIPMDGLIKAKEHIARMGSTRDAGLWEWDWLGPSNIGGRIRAILPDPNNASVLWLGGVAGGIWKSSNSGASWSVVDDFMASLAITSLSFDPSTTSIMYAATGEGFNNGDALPGNGIFKSTDGGVTWNQLASTNNTAFYYVNRLAAHPDPDSAGILYAVTAASAVGGTNRVYKTINGGVTWVNKLTTASRACDVNPNEVIVGCRNHVYLSTNYGQTWSNETSGAANKLPSDGGRCEVSFCPSNTQRIYVSLDRNGGEIWRSTDNGSTWSIINGGTNYLGTQGWYDNAIWVNPANSDQLVVGGVDLYRSSNGGVSLAKISRWQDYHNGGSANSAHADQHMIVQAADYNTTTNPEVYFGNDGGIQKTNNIWTVTTNSGWINLANTSLGITQFFGGAAASVGGAQDNDKLRYKLTGDWSGPHNWFQAQTGDGGFAAVNYSNPTILYGEYVYLSISKSTNSGASYGTFTTGLSDAGDDLRALFIAPFSLDPNNPAILVAGGSRIWRTVNSAGNWSQIGAEIGSYVNGNGDTEYYKCSTIDIDYGNSALIWVGYDNGNVALTTNTGTDWTRVDLNDGGLPNRFVTDIAINPNNSNEVFVTFGGYYNNNVWYTPDAGVSWENRSGSAPYNLPSLQVNTVRYHPSKSDWVYVGTDLGIFATQDRGINWSVVTNFNGFEGPVNTEVAELFWQGNEFLIAATHGRGMFRTATPPGTIYVNASAGAGGNGSPFRFKPFMRQCRLPVQVQQSPLNQAHILKPRLLLFSIRVSLL